MFKKSQSLSINTIIIAAIALAVLVVIFVIFSGRLSIFTKGIGEATNCQQSCKVAGYEQFTDIEENGECSGTSYPNALPGSFIIKDGVRRKCCCAK